MQAAPKQHRATEGRIDTLGKPVALRNARNIVAAQCAGIAKSSYLPRLRGSQGYYGKLSVQ